MLLVASDDERTLGKPVVHGAKVIATIKGNGRGPKIRVATYKSKVRTRRHRGHRQLYTRLAIDRIEFTEAELAK